MIDGDEAAPHLIRTDDERAELIERARVATDGNVGVEFIPLSWLLAAPEMAEALKLADQFMNGPRPPAGIFAAGTRESVQNLIRAALAKAGVS